ncbi:MAG: V-type ATP synthase subunit F [Clostridia bacterium]|nr:V-type ATP synthase subunit F [Clostridia bacterium]
MVDSEKIAVIGSKDSILVFKAVGCDIFGVSNAEKTRIALNKAISQYKIILITDDYAKYVEDIIADTQTTAYPVVLVIPSGNKRSDYALNKISEDVERALGVNILKNNKEN